MARRHVMPSVLHPLVNQQSKITPEWAHYLSGLESLNEDDIEVRTLESEGASGNTSLDVPGGYAIRGIYVKNLTGNAVTGGIRIGTTAGGTDVVDALGVGANSEFYITGHPPICRRFFHRTNDTELFIEAITSWNSASLDIYIVLDRIFA